MLTAKSDQRALAAHLRRVAAEEGEPEKYGIKIIEIETNRTVDEIIPEEGTTGSCLGLLKYGNLKIAVMDDITDLVNNLPEAKLHAVLLQTEQAHQQCIALMEKAADPSNLTPAEDEELASIISSLGRDILLIVSRRNKCAEVREEERWDEKKLDFVRSFVGDIVMNRVNGANDHDAGKIALNCFMEYNRLGGAKGAVEKFAKEHPMLAALAMLAMASGIPPEEFAKMVDEAERQAREEQN